MNIIFSIPYDRKFYKLNEIICPLADLPCCIKGPMHAANL